MPEVVLTVSTTRRAGCRLENQLLTTVVAVEGCQSRKRLLSMPETHSCRELVNEGFPLHDDHIPSLLENIGDHEQDVMDTILDAVASAR